jgi:hypothetical protein
MHRNPAAVFTDPQSISMHVVTAILPLHLLSLMTINESPQARTVRQKIERTNPMEFK